MFTGKIIAWNSITGRGIIEDRRTGETCRFSKHNLACEDDYKSVRAELEVFYTKTQQRSGSAYASRVEIMSSAFGRFRKEHGSADTTDVTIVL